MSNNIIIEGQNFGHHHPFIIAEIGINHNGELSLAKECIHAAAEAGVNGVKFQHYHTEDFINDKNLLIHYQSQGKSISEPQYDLFKRCELTFDQLAELKEECDRHALNFHATPTSTKGIKDLQQLNVNILKNGSDYLLHPELLKAMAKSQLTTVLSTGMASLKDITTAVNLYQNSGGNSLVLLHCTSLYPTPNEHINLKRMQTIQQHFNLPTGFSDHSIGNTAAIAATIMGTCWIEKHFTLDKNLPGPDHWFSINPDELKQLQHDIRHTEKLLGNGSFHLSPDEQNNKTSFRLSCVAARNLKANSVIHKNDITYQRPGNGIPPHKAQQLIGLTLKQNITAHKLFSMDMFL